METINIQNYRIVKNEKEIRGVVRPTVQIYRMTPKARYFKEKIISNYFYGTVQQQEEAIAKFIANIERQAKEVADRKQVKKDVRANMVNPFKVGDILYDSWGYDQTNIDYFQVVSVGNRSVKIRSIGQKFVRGDAGWAETISPAKDDFIGEEMNRNLQVDSRGGIHVPSPRRGWLFPTTEGSEHYQSHYA